MGERGPGATRIKRAREEVAANPRKLPWERKGLSRVERVIKFLQFLPITKGKLEGKKMRLLAKQRQFIEDVYGPTDRAGRRKIKTAIKSEPKGNGKTGLLAGLALCHLIGPEAEQRGEVYSAAIDRGQAAITFTEMEAIIMAVPEFAARCNVTRFHKKIEDYKTRSTYEALSQDARKAHGLAPSFFVYDEFAQAKSRELLDNLINGMGKRNESLGMIISTQAPDDLHPLSQLIDDGLSGLDDTVYVMLDAAPEDADIFDPATWKACNPALGKFLDRSEIETAANRARRLPTFEPSFRNLRLNQRVDAKEDQRLFSRKNWDEGSEEVNIEHLRGRKCFGGLDLSAARDLTSLVLLFPDDEPDTGYDVLSFFWTPGDTIKDRAKNDRAPYELWRDEGFLFAPPGRVIRYGFIANELAKMQADFEIETIGYDRWRIEQFRQDLSDIGCDVDLLEFGQGFKDMAPALDYLAEIALDGRLRHGGHPVLTWCFSNAITVTDPAGNLKFDKDKARNRIDGAVALAMAAGTAKRFIDPVNAGGSYLDEGELLVI